MFALALGGMSGIHLRFNPGTQNLLMSYREDSHTRESIHWASSEWVHVCLRVIQGDVQQELIIKAQWNNESEKSKKMKIHGESRILPYLAENVFYGDFLMPRRRCIGMISKSALRQEIHDTWAA